MLTGFNCVGNALASPGSGLLSSESKEDSPQD